MDQLYYLEITMMFQEQIVLLEKLLIFTMDHNLQLIWQYKMSLEIPLEEQHGWQFIMVVVLDGEK